MADLDRVHDRPVVNVIGAVQIHNLLDRTRIDARQPADTCEQVSVGSRVIHGPLTGPRAVGSQAKALMVRITKDIGIPKTRPDPFVLLILPIGGKREILVLDCRVFFKGSLRVQPPRPPGPGAGAAHWRREPVAAGAPDFRRTAGETGDESGGGG